jgi:hypothetical protein
MKYTGLVLSVFAFAAQASADQCAYVTRDMAAQALRIVMDAGSVQTYCEPCGDRGATYVDVKAVGMADVNYQGYWEMQINGRGVDLAYTFVNGMNLAAIVSCPTQGVSRSILEGNSEIGD